MHFALPLLFPVQGFSPFANVTLSLTKLLDLAFCQIPLPSERGPLGGVIRRGEGFVQLAGRPYSRSSQKVLYSLQQPRCRSPRPGQIQPPDNAVSAEYCTPFSQTGQLWPFLSLQSGILFDALHKGNAVWLISHPQHHFKDVPTKKARW